MRRLERATSNWSVSCWLPARRSTRKLITGRRLHSAAWSGRRDVVETLLNAGAKIDHAAPYGWRPIDDALWENHFDVVRYLEQCGAKLDACLAAGLGRTADAKRLMTELASASSAGTAAKPPQVEWPPPVFWACALRTTRYAQGPSGRMTRWPTRNWIMIIIGSKDQRCCTLPPRRARPT